jgi:urease subunit alpha
MVRNGYMPSIEVNPETFEVFVNGKHAYVPPAKDFSLGQLYWFG